MPVGRRLQAEHLRVLAGGQPKTVARSSTSAGLGCCIYPKWRHQSLVLQYLSAAFVGLRGHLSDELREVNFCRVRLAELQRVLEEPQPGEVPQSAGNGSPNSREAAVGRTLFLSSCKNLYEAVDLYMSGITDDHLLELDVQMEAMLREGFTALVHVCLTSANVLKDVHAAMLAVAADYAAGHLPPTSVAELFFDQFTDPQEAEGEVSQCFDEAAPEISVGRAPRGTTAPFELTLVATPDDRASEQFKQLVQSAVPQADIQYAPSPEDIILYRERGNLALTDLEHMGPTGHDAYVQMTSTDNFTPHSRCDINFRKP
ncbi:MAG: hypothetical protein U0797_01480 [Gemmataceae bacterium]